MIPFLTQRLTRSTAVALFSFGLTAGVIAAPAHAQAPARASALTLWKQGGSAFGIFVPSERAPGATDANGKRLPPLYTDAGAKALAANPLLDYLFLNLEGQYDAGAVKAMVAGLASLPATTPPTWTARVHG